MNDVPLRPHTSQANTIDDLVNHTVGRVLDLFGVEHETIKRWKGMKNDVLRDEE